jgi:uncharacterized protein
MMKEIEIITHNKADLSNSLLIVAFPTVGLVSIISARFMVDTLKLEEIGSIESPYLIPATVIHNGIPLPPARIYAGRKTCGPNGSCSQLVIILSEFMPPWEIMVPLTETIISWAQQKKCKYIVTLEGITVVGEKITAKPSVYGLGTTKATRDLLNQFHIEESKDGLITGISGVLLYKAVQKKLDMLCFLSEVHVSYPDSRSAGRLLEKINFLIPDIKIDPKPLYIEAESIEHTIQTFMQQAKTTTEHMQRKGSDAIPRMYG